MKKKNMAVMFALAVGLCLGGLLLPGSAEAASRIKIDKKHFPGKIFREYVKEFDKNKDGYLSAKERKAVKKIEFDNYEYAPDAAIDDAAILNCKGMEYFPQAEEFRIVYYRLKNLKFDMLKNLKKVDFSDCQKADGKESDAEYDFTKNKKLQEITFCNMRGSLKKILIAQSNNLRRFMLKYPEQLEELDLSRFSRLEELSLYGLEIESLDLSRCISLLKASISENPNLTRLDCSACPNLKELLLNDNHLTSLNLSQNPDLENLNVSFNDLSDLDVSQNLNLHVLQCSHNLLKTLDVTMLKKLGILVCSGMKLKELNLNGNPELWELVCRANQIEILDVSENKMLSMIVCGANPIEELNLSGLSGLVLIECDYDRLTSIEFCGDGGGSYMGNCIAPGNASGFDNSELEEEILQKSQLLPSVGGAAEEGIPINKEHFPDYALRYVVLADFDINRDGVLSEQESLAKQPLNLEKYWGILRREIDCTGMGYLKGITEVKYCYKTTLLNNIFSGGSNQ